MEAVNPSPLTSEANPETNTQPRVPIFKTIFMTVAVLLLVAVAYLAGRMTGGGMTAFAPEQTLQPHDSATTTTPAQEIGTFGKVSEAGPQAYFAVENGKLTIIPIDAPENKVVSKVGEVQPDGGASGFGSSSYLIAPGLKKIAVIQDNTLSFVSSDESVVTVPELPVQYLSGWSPNSQRLVVYVSYPTAASVITSYGPAANDPVSEVHTLSTISGVSGFYLLDLATQKIVYLGALNGIGFENFIDNSRVLVSGTAEFPNNSYFEVNIDTAQVDATKIFTMFTNDFGSQFSFSQDGKIWAVTLAPRDKVSTDQSVMSVNVGTYPNHPDTVIRSGSFAQNQSPLVSPDGSKVALRSYDILNGPNYIHIYADGTESRVAEGVAQIWADNDRLIYTHHEGGATSDTYIEALFMYNTVTKEKTELYKYSLK